MDITKLKITLSVLGRFHAFNVARQLEGLGALSKLITTYPKFFITKQQISRAHIQSFTLLEIFSRVTQKYYPRLLFNWNPQYFVAESFSRLAAQYLPEESNILIAFSGSAYHTVMKAKQLGMMTILERHSCHIATQQDLLLEEYSRFGLPFHETHPKIIENELQEYKSCDFINVPSEWVKTSFLSKGFQEKKIFCIPLGVDLDQFYPQPKKDNKFRVIYTGQISIRKGVHYLLKAFHQLNLPNAELWIIGNISHEMKNTVAHYERMNSNILFFGHKPQSQLQTYYSQCNVFCLPSIEDGFGVVVAQAMACGLPIICTKNVGAKDLIKEGETGFSTPIRDVLALKEKITWFYENPEKIKQMGIQARQELLTKRKDWKSYTKNLLEKISSQL